jgi:hypothetical protein
MLRGRETTSGFEFSDEFTRYCGCWKDLMLCVSSWNWKGIFLIKNLIPEYISRLSSVIQDTLIKLRSCPYLSNIEKLGIYRLSYHKGKFLGISTHMKLSCLRTIFLVDRLINYISSLKPILHVKFQ